MNTILSLILMVSVLSGCFNNKENSTESSNENSIENIIPELSVWDGSVATAFAGGALGGLVSGAGGSSAGTVLAKFLKHPIKNFLTDLGENLIMNFTNWYSQFVTEGVINSYA